MRKILKSKKKIYLIKLDEQDRSQRIYKLLELKILIYQGWWGYTSGKYCLKDTAPSSNFALWISKAN